MKSFAFIQGIYFNRIDVQILLAVRSCHWCTCLGASLYPPQLCHLICRLLAGDRRQLEVILDAQPGYRGLGMAVRKAYNWWIGDGGHAQRTKERAPGARVLNACIRRQHELGDKRSAKECCIIALERGRRRLRRPVRVAIVTHRAGQ